MSKISPKAQYFLLLFAHFANAGVVLEKPLINLGQQKAGKLIQQSFAFHVEGTNAEIVDLVPSCACLVPTVERRIYLPNEKGKIAFEVRTLGQAPGKHRHGATLIVRDPDYRRIDVAVEIDLIQEITVEPTNLIVSMTAPGAIERTITIRDQRPRPLEINSLVSSSTRITGRFPTSPPTDRNLQTVRLKIDGDFPPGKSFERVRLVTNDPEYPELELPITIDRPSRIRVSLDTIAVRLPTVKPTAPLRRVVCLLDEQKKPIHIASAQSDHPAITTTIARGPQPSPSSLLDQQSVSVARVEIAIDPAKLSLPLRANFTIIIDQPICQTFRIPISVD